MLSKNEILRPVAAPRERIVELDVLRGLAFLAVVLQHALGVYVRKADIQISDAVMLGMLFNFTKFAVPAFVFVTGIVLFYNYYEQLDYPKFIWKRTLEIFLPYLLWTGIYDLYYHGVPAINHLWLKAFAKNVLFGTGAYHLWFVVMIFQFYLLYPVLLALFKWVRSWITTQLRFIGVITLLAALYILLMWFSAGYIAGGHFQVKAYVLQLLLIKFRDRNFLFFSFYFVLGGIAGVSISKWRDFIIRSVSWNSMAFVALFVWIGYELMQGLSGGRINLNYSTSLKPSMFLYTVSEILLVYGLSLAIAKSGSRLLGLLDFTGKYSYGAYLVHALALNYVNKALTGFVPLANYVWASTLAFMLCTLLSLGVTGLISRIPYGKLLIGPFGGRGK